MEKMIDTLNDLPNVLWIVSEEAPDNSTWWNSHQIAHVRIYESRKRYQHPIGYAGLIPSTKATDRTIYNSDADWVAPGVRISPARSCGDGRPHAKWTSTTAITPIGRCGRRHRSRTATMHGKTSRPATRCSLWTPTRALPPPKPQPLWLTHQRNLHQPGRALGKLQE